MGHLTISNHQDIFTKVDSLTKTLKSIPVKPKTAPLIIKFWVAVEND